MIEINTYEEFLNIIHNNPEKYVFIDFYAKWCKPCMKATPIIEQIEKRLTVDNTGIDFYQSPIVKCRYKYVNLLCDILITYDM